MQRGIVKVVPSLVVLATNSALGQFSKSRYWRWRGLPQMESSLEFLNEITGHDRVLNLRYKDMREQLHSEVVFSPQFLFSSHGQDFSRSMVVAEIRSKKTQHIRRDASEASQDRLALLQVSLQLPVASISEVRSGAIRLTS